MNNNRRFVIKALAIGSVGLVGYGGFKLFNPEDRGHIETWFEHLNLDANLAVVQDQFPDPINTLLTHLNIENNVSFDVLENKISSKVSQDFTQGNTVKLDQWYISLTEALILASAFDVLGVKPQIKVIKNYENAPFENFMEVEKWGPQETYQGIKFNEQPDGHCGLWVVATGVTDALQIYIANKKRKVFVNEKGLTTGIYQDVDAFISTIAESEIIAYDEINHRKQVIGTFKVLPPPKYHQYEDGTTSKVFSEIRKWGPQNASVGEAFNIQPNGYAAFWIKGTSRSSNVKLRFNDIDHPAAVQKDLITSSLSPQDLPNETGKYPVYLISAEHSEKLLLGMMEIR